MIYWLEKLGSSLGKILKIRTRPSSPHAAIATQSFFDVEGAKATSRTESPMWLQSAGRSISDREITAPVVSVVPTERLKSSSPPNSYPTATRKGEGDAGEPVSTSEGPTSMAVMGSERVWGSPMRAPVFVLHTMMRLSLEAVRKALKPTVKKWHQCWFSSSWPVA